LDEDEDESTVRFWSNLRMIPVAAATRNLGA